jgi:carbonic anhydrase
LIFNEGPNDLFVVRVAGNGLGSDVLGSLKYAIEHLGGSLKLVIVHTSARKLVAAFGPDIARREGYRRALIETSIVTNAALAAYSVQQEIETDAGSALRAVYGVYLLETREVWTPRVGEPDGAGLAAAPGDLAGFEMLGEAMVNSSRIKALLAAEPETSR